MVITETKTYPTPVGKGSSTEAYLMSIGAPEWALKAIFGKIKVTSNFDTAGDFGKAGHAVSAIKHTFQLIAMELPACYDYSDKPMD